MHFFSSALLTLSLHLGSVFAQSSCPIQNATFDETSMSFTPNNFNYKGLHWTNFSVIAANPKTTYFTATSSPNILMLQNGKAANISVIPPNQFYRPLNFSAGCSHINSTTKKAEPADCSLAFATPIRGIQGPTTVSVFLSKNNYVGTQMQQVMWGGGAPAYINVSLFDTASDVTAYFDSFTFNLNCNS